MAIVGGAIIPFLQGLLADKTGIQYSFILPVFCYIYIMFFGFKGADVIEKEEEKTNEGELQYEL